MKLLPSIIRLGSGSTRFEYRQLIRKGSYAIYEQHQFGRLVAYEVIRIMSHNGYRIGDTEIPAAESMPSSSAWGQHGFTFGPDAKAEAVAKMVRMMN